MKHGLNTDENPQTSTAAVFDFSDIYVSSVFNPWLITKTPRDNSSGAVISR
jgi:hypothetical protein